MLRPIKVWLLLLVLIASLVGLARVPRCPLGDLNGNCKVDVQDLLILVAQWSDVREPFHELDGLVVIEAEHYFDRSDGSGTVGACAWQCLTGEGATGDGYMQALPDDGYSIETDIEAYSPRLSYLIDFNTAETYYLWLKGMAENADSGSVHYGLDGQALSGGWDDSATIPMTDFFTWQSSRGDGAKTTILVPSAGLHTLDLWMREDGAKIDRLLLATYRGRWTPESPSESPGFSKPTADLDDSGSVNLIDFALLGNSWLAGALVITEHLEDLKVCQGHQAILGVRATGAEPMTYQWQKDGFDLSDGGRISGATTDTLQIAEANSVDAGDYRCVVTNDYGTVISNEAALKVSACIGVSPSGHYVTYNGETLMLIGDSGTQCASQNSNLDHRQWIDDCAARGIRAVHVWSFVPARQKQDGSQIEDRWGYVIPDVMPWARKSSGASARDQRYQWNLQAFDEGPDGDMTHYWPRMRDMCSYAKSKDMMVGISVFTGWTKHDYSWVFHPLNINNGGHLADKSDAVIIASPGTEVWQEPWSNSWSNAMKTQWVWEQLAKKFIDVLGCMGNVFFVFFDEHSYSEGNMGDHFLNFFKSRGQVWVDWAKRRANVTFVYDATHQTDKNSLAVSGFNGNPKRPHLMLEGHPYMGEDLRTAIWTFSMGGGHYFFHADEGQETVRTGIMGYDPYVPGGDKGMYKRDWLGHASRFFNRHVDDLDTLAPHNELSSSGTYCLSEPGGECVVYSKIGSPTTFSVNLSAAARKTLNCRFYNPRNGQFRPAFQRTGASSSEPFTKPDTDDWVLHIFED